MENTILDTIKILGTALIGIAFIAPMVIQVIKEAAKIEDAKAQLVSLGVGFILSALVFVSYLDQMSYHLNVSQWIGGFLFLVIGAISPSGGYKTLRSLLGGGNGNG